MTRGVTPDILRDLNCVTPPEAIKQRPVSRSTNKMLDYVDARYVQDVLDAIVGPENWQSQFADSGIGGVRCGIGILVDYTPRDEQGALIIEQAHSEWVWKWDVGKESDIEPVKGGHSGAFKRAGVHWGIARDLYDEDRETTQQAQAAQQQQRAPVQGRFTPTPAQAGPSTEPPLPFEDGDAQDNGFPWSCSVHGAVKVVPGGTSAKTGKAYNAFYACPESGCNETARGIKVKPEHLP